MQNLVDVLFCPILKANRQVIRCQLCVFNVSSVWCVEQSTVLAHLSSLHEIVLPWMVDTVPCETVIYIFRINAGQASSPVH
jgi:hypothetical protein